MTAARKVRVRPGPALRLVASGERIGGVGAKKARRRGRAGALAPVADHGRPPDGAPGLRTLAWSTSWVQRTANAHRSMTGSGAEGHWGRLELDLTSDDHMDRLQAAAQLIQQAAGVYQERAGYEHVGELLREIVAYVRSPALEPEIVELLAFRLEMVREGRFDAAWLVWPYSHSWDRVEGARVDERLRAADAALAEAKAERRGEVRPPDIVPRRAAMFVARASVGASRGGVEMMLRVVSEEERDIARRLKSDPASASILAGCFDAKAHVRRGAYTRLLQLVQALGLGGPYDARVFAVAVTHAKKAWRRRVLGGENG